MKRCLSLYKPNQVLDFCSKATKMLFGGIKIGRNLDFEVPNFVYDNGFEENVKQISISGVQIKYGLKLIENRLQLTSSNGRYLLKPIPVGRFRYLDSAPENEHLTMQIANQVFKIETAANSLIYFKSGEPAYLVKRFDVKDDGSKWLQEDFTQIMQVNSQQNGLNYKYDGSYENIATLIKKHCVAWPVEIERFFKVLIFNYLISNGDAHLKNFSLIQTSFGDFRLSPAYDLLCTFVHTPSEAAMALDLFEDNYFTNQYNTLGYYSYADFYEFGVKIGINHVRVEKIIVSFLIQSESVQTMVENSFLATDIKAMYWSQYQSRLRALSYKL